MALGLGGGSGTVGTGYVKIKPDAEGFGQDLENQVGNEANGRSGEMGRRASMAFRGAFLAGAATIGKSLFDFAGFDAGMREVFTLMPDITQPAMDEMTSQVKSFAGEFGVLPDEVIPSLYNSISAGVPPDNVFAFLETAQKLAKGGATDLATAVDGLSSVVNAYGADTITATQASDALFTAVKLGKTTVDEMSASLFQVAPIASSFGVSFNEVSASIATITAQGTPTAVAATQIKAAIAELGKEGTKASDVFAELSGKSFAQFTAEGGTMTEALTMMQLAAEENGSSLVDMFGSIEAGQAALGLVKDLDKTNANLVALGESAGATDVAFETMNKGLAATMARLKARFSVLMIDLGESLAPTFETIGEALAGVLEIFMAMPAPMRTLIVVGGTLLAGLAAFAGPILKAVQLFKMLGSTMTLLAANPWVLVALALVAVTYLIIKNWDKVKAWFEEFWKFLENGIEFIKGVWSIFVHDDFTGLGFGMFEDHPIALFLFDLRNDLEDLVGFFVDRWNEITGAVSSAASDIGAAVQTGADVVTGIVDFHLMLVTTTFSTAWNIVRTTVTTAWQGIRTTVETIGGGVIGFITSIPGKITSAFTGLAGLISTPFVVAFGAIKSAWNSTVGGFGFTTPGWIPGLGGQGFTIPRMAAGGVLTDPTLFLGGEYPGAGRDPEIVTPQSTMRATMMDALAASGSGGSGITLETHLHVDNLTEPSTFRRYLEQMSTELTRVVQRELDRNRDAKGLARGGIS